MARGKRIMNTLHLLRHAKAVPQEEEGADRSRSLEKRGRRAAQAMAEWVAEHGLAPTLVLCSSSVRTRQTLDIIASSFKRPPQVLFEDGLYLASARQLLARLHRVPDEIKEVMLVGHNPGFHELATSLSSVTVGPLITRLAGFPTGALASFRMEIPWAALDRRRAELIEVVLPKALIRGSE
jgi:phosphohistidine phosphatase